MIGKHGEDEDMDFDDIEDDIDDDDDLDEDAMPDIGGETIIDVSGELKVDDFYKGDKSDPYDAARRRAIRKRLEEIEELRNAKLDDTFNFDLDDEEV